MFDAHLKSNLVIAMHFLSLNNNNGNIETIYLTGNERNVREKELFVGP